MVAGSEIKTRAIVIQQKTGRPVQFEITSDVRTSLLASLERGGGSVEDYAFPSWVDRARHMSTRQYAWLVDEWVTAIGLRSEEYGTHSLRRTKASMIYRATGNIRAIQILLGHSKIENTVRYLGVDVEDALCSWLSEPRSDVERPSDAAWMAALISDIPGYSDHRGVESGLAAFQSAGQSRPRCRNFATTATDLLSAQALRHVSR